MKHKGFTLVELLIVITVIGILAAIGIVSYGVMRDNAMDAKIQAAVKAAGDAVSLHEGQGGARPATGYVTVAGGVDSLIPKYLKADYRDGLRSKHVPDSGKILRFYSCPDAKGQFVVYASLNNPNNDEKGSFTKIRNSCGHGESQAPTSGAEIYNYAQVF